MRRLKVHELRAACDPAGLPFRSTDEVPSLEILCARPAGVRAPDGTFPDGTVNAAVEQGLIRNVERLRQLRTEPTR